MRKVAVVLSGCGFQDGSEITESISALITLSQLQAQVTCFAPDTQFQVTDHLRAQSTGETRSVLTEAARLARGHISSLSELDPQKFDALVFPGGFGAALNLSTWAKDGSRCQVLPDVEKVIRAFHDDSKPICAICIAPTLLAKVLGHENVTLTIGNDAATAAEIAKTGALHENCAVDDYVTDREHKIITTPAYMYDAKPAEVFKGIQGALKELVEMA
jgi:enhancing lycopene biosynthesis protein 2